MRCFWAVLLPAFTGIFAPARAQEYPVKPARFVVPYAPGGGLDVVARPLSQKLAELWSQPVLIDNRPRHPHRRGSLNHHPVQIAPRRGIERLAMMHHAALVPHQQVARAPVVTPRKLRLCGVVPRASSSASDAAASSPAMYARVRLRKG
jgi:hypothetical protein